MRDKVILACTICLNRNYSTDKNKSTQSERMEIRKYCKRCGTHTLHRQTK